LPGARSLRDAFDTAQGSLARARKPEHVAASKPQAYFGKAMEEKLASMNPLQ